MKKPEKSPQDARKRPALRKQKTRAKPGAAGAKAARTPRRGARRAAVALLLFAPLALITCGLLVMLLLYPRARAPEAPEAQAAGAPLRLQLPAGLSAEETSAMLSSAGLLDEPVWFTRYLQLRGRSAQPGPHFLPHGLTYGELAARLAREGEKVKLTLPEGLTRFAIAERLEAAEICARAEFLRASQEPALLSALGVPGESAEGYLFPATYNFRKNSDPQEVLQRLVRELIQRFDALSQKHAQGAEDLRQTLGFERAPPLRGGVGAGGGGGRPPPPR